MTLSSLCTPVQSNTLSQAFRPDNHKKTLAEGETHAKFIRYFCTASAQATHRGRTPAENREYKEQIDLFKAQLAQWRKLDVQYESNDAEREYQIPAKRLTLQLGHPEFPIEEVTELQEQRFEMPQIKTGEVTIKVGSLLRMQKGEGKRDDKVVTFYGHVERIFRSVYEAAGGSERILVRRFTWRPERYVPGDLNAALGQPFHLGCSWTAVSPLLLTAPLCAVQV